MSRWDAFGPRTPGDDCDEDLSPMTAELDAAEARKGGVICGVDGCAEHCVSRSAAKAAGWTTQTSRWGDIDVCPGCRKGVVSERYAPTPALHRVLTAFQLSCVATRNETFLAVAEVAVWRAQKTSMTDGLAVEFAKLATLIAGEQDECAEQVACQLAARLKKDGVKTVAPQLRLVKS